MSKIVEPPKPRKVKCKDCRATIEYLPEEIEEGYKRDYLGSIEYEWKRIKCPRQGCPGYGYIQFVEV